MAADIEVKAGADITEFLSKIDAAKAKVGQLTESQGQLKDKIKDVNDQLKLNEKEMGGLTNSISKLNLQTRAGQREAALFRDQILKIQAGSKDLNTELKNAKTELTNTTGALRIATTELKAAEKGSSGFLGGIKSAYGGLRTLANIIPGIGISGLVLLIAGPLIDAFGGLTDAEKKAAEEAKKFSKSLDEARAKGEAEGLQLKNYVAIASDQTQSLKTRNEALKEANKILGDHGEKLTLVNIATKAVTEEVNKFTEATIQQALAAKYADRIADLLVKRAEATKDFTAAQQKYNDVLAATNKINSSNAAQRGQVGLTTIPLQNLQNAAGAYRAIAKEVTSLAGDMGAAQLAAAQLFGSLGTHKKDGATREIETIADVLAKLDRQIAEVSAEEIRLHTDEAQKKIQDIEAAISHLIDKFKLTAESPVIIELEAEIQGIKLEEYFKKVFKELHTAPIPIPFEIQAGLQEEAKKLKEAYKRQFAPALQDAVKQNGLNISPFANSTDVDRMFKEAELAGHGVSKSFMSGLSAIEFDKFFKRITKSFEDFQVLFKESAKNIKVDAVAGLGEAIGNAIGGGKDTFKGLFDGIFTSVGDQLEGLGKFLIKSAIEVKLAKDAFKKLLASPVAAIAVGIGLIALGALIKSQISNVAPGFAAGGFVSGPGSSKSDSIHARLSAGEYVINAGSVNKYGKSFFDMINGGGISRNNNFANGGIVNSGPIGGGQLITVVVEGNLRGSDIYISNKRAALKIGRNG